MKTRIIYLAFIACFILSFNTNAQWSKIGVTLGYDNDMVHGLSADYIAGASNIDMSGIDLSVFNKATLYSMACENPHVRAYASYNLPKYTSTTANVALVGIFNRWDDVGYYSEGEYISFGSISNEIAIESSLDKRWDLWNILYLDLGAGANTGVGFGGYSYLNYYGQSNQGMLSDRSMEDVITANDVAAMEVEEEYGDLYGSNKTSLHARVFGKIGAGIIFFDTVEIGAAMRYGLGMRKHIGGSFARTNFVSMETNIAYRF